jgi:hypothetical protein
MSINERKLDRSPAFAEAAARFLDAVGEWIDACVARYTATPPSDAPDQLAYVAAWEPYLRLRPQPAALAFLTQKRDAVQAHFTQTGQWRHGYWMMQDVSRGVEHFNVFLRTLAQLAPDDPQTRSQVLDAAEHFGNWKAAVPPWYDAKTKLFRSHRFGAAGVEELDGQWNIPDHLRGIRLCLLAYSLGGGDRYLAFARDYAGLWADALLMEQELPVGLGADGPLFALNKRAEAFYLGGLGNADHHTETPIDRAENFLAAGGINVFLELWARTGEARFLRAAERLLDLLTPQLPDPDAGAVADLLRTYRRLTGSSRYDDAVRSALASLAPYEIRTIGIQPDVMRLTRLTGVGKEADMPLWFENLHLRRHNPITLAAGAEITGDAILAAQALDIGRVYFELARQSLADGCDDGGANTVAAVARGHRRDNGAGVVTAALQPLIEAFGLVEPAPRR